MKLLKEILVTWSIVVKLVDARPGSAHVITRLQFFILAALFFASGYGLANLIGVML